MSTRMSSTKGELFPATEAKPFRMICIYDSADACREAAHASEVILRELGEDVLVNKTTWDLNSLEAVAQRDTAAEEASQSDVIVIAISGETPSESLMNWAAQWQGKRSLSSGLIALIPSGSSETAGAVADFLYETAITANMDFLCRKKRRFDTGE